MAPLLPLHLLYTTSWNSVPPVREPGPPAFISLIDAETGRVVEVDTRHRAVRDLFEARSVERGEQLSGELKKLGVDELPIRTDEDYLTSLRRFFHMREKRFR